jgi:hypothetical protein
VDLSGAWAAPAALGVGLAAALAVVLVAVVGRRLTHARTGHARGRRAPAPGPGGTWTVVEGRLVGTADRRGEPLEPEEGVGFGATVSPGTSALVATVAQGAFARVVAPGATAHLGPDERPYRAVSVEPKEISGAVVDAYTRDAVLVQRLEWRAVVRLRCREGAAPFPGEPYPFDPQAARLAAFGPADLAAAVREEIEDAVADAIRTLRMGDLVDPGGEAPPMERAFDLARSNLSGPLAAWGFELTRLSVRRLALEPGVQEHLTSLWRARTLQVGDSGVSPSVRRGQRVEAPAAPLRLETPPQPEGAAGGSRTGAAPRVERPREERAAPAQAVRHSEPSELIPPSSEVESVGEEVTLANGLLPGYSQVSAETLAGLRAAATAVRAARSGSSAPSTPNPVSFSSFLGGLRERARAGDDVAESVLRQVLDVMARIDAGAGNPRADPRNPGSHAPQEPVAVQPTLDID